MVWTFLTSWDYSTEPGSSELNSDLYIDEADLTRLSFINQFGVIEQFSLERIVTHEMVHAMFHINGDVEAGAV